MGRLHMKTTNPLLISEIKIANGQTFLTFQWVNVVVKVHITRTSGD